MSSKYNDNLQHPDLKVEKSQHAPFRSIAHNPTAYHPLLPSLLTDSEGLPVLLWPLLRWPVLELCRDFFLKFESSSPDADSLKKLPYMQQMVAHGQQPNSRITTCQSHTVISPFFRLAVSLSCPSQQAIVNHESCVLQLRLDDVAAFYPSSDFLSRLLQNGLRYQQLFYRAADRIIRSLVPTVQHVNIDSQDIWMQHRETRFREARQREIEQAGGQAVDRDVDSDEEDEGRPSAGSLSKQAPFPVELTRRYELQIIPSSFHKVSPMRSIRADAIGSLVSLRGIITRVTDVAPLVKVVTYICTTCGWETYQPVNDRTFTPLTDCPSSACTKDRVRGHLVLQTRGSKFVKYQAVRLQELPAEVPVGNIPRSVNVRLYGELCRTVKPGDEVTLSGIFLPTPYTGYRAIRAGLTADVYIEVTHLIPAKRAYNQIELTPELIAEMEDSATGKDWYDQLASSIAPEIFGHADVKKALLLLLISGVSKALPDGVNIRGDLNILLMGDPGVAKSQLLKHIAAIAPRGVYTTGKGSSGVGLTAAVIRDPVTGDMSLEGGSLVLADRGVCCIDEFDKMEEGDRTAIHEVMEQQTVSIAKAGITTTLNARTAVVAAANPVYGRWDKRKSLEANLGLPTSLLSRFDLSFIILDRAMMDHDLNLAAHVTHVHMHSSHPSAQQSPPLSSSFLRSFIAHSRTFSPHVPRHLVDEIVGHYISLRQEDDHHNSAGSGSHNNRQRFVTPRSLLSILRLAQAHARCHLKRVVDADDIAEAIRLVYVSKHSEDEDDETDAPVSTSAASGNRRQRRDVDGEIFRMIKARREETGRNKLSRAELERLALSRGYKLEEFNACLDRYEVLNVWMVQRSGFIVFIQGSEQFRSDSRGGEEDEEMED